MDRQQVYNTVRDALLKQGAKAQVPRERRDDTFAHPSFMCVYRGGGPNGDCRCGIGHLIPDALYRNSMEGKSVGMLVDENPELAAHLGVTAVTGTDVEKRAPAMIERAQDKGFLQALQSVHDEHAVSDWPAALAEVAREHELVP